MTSVSTLATAGEALQIGSAITGDEVPQVANHGGRHWSYKLMVVSAVVGAVISIVAGILSQIPFLISGVLLCATGAIGAFYLKRFGILKSLEEYVGHLSHTVKKVEEVVGALKKGNEELKKINEGLDETLEERSKILDKSNKKLGLMSSLYENLKKVTFGLTAQVASFNSENELLDENVDELLEYIKQLDFNNDKLAGEVDELIEQNDKFDKENEVFKVLVNKLEDNLGTLKAAYTNQREEIKALKEAVKKLSLLRGDFSKGAQKVEESEKMYKETEQKLQLLVEQLKDLKAIPKIVAALEMMNQQSKEK